jgi:hypothetical protein
MLISPKPTIVVSYLFLVFMAQGSAAADSASELNSSKELIHLGSGLIHHINMGRIQEYSIETHGRISVQLDELAIHGDKAIFAIRNNSPCARQVEIITLRDEKKIIIRYGNHQKKLIHYLPDIISPKEALRFGTFFTGTKPKKSHLLITIKLVQ